jgi:[NiFe] hydrogenase assembly HybE family chaperone
VNPFEDEVGIAKLEARLGVLVGQFRTLAQGMTDLPLYNAEVGVEAVDFLPFGDMGFGVLVTPWFMSALFLPLDPVPYDSNRVGAWGEVPLPAGGRAFQLSGDEVIGLYWAHSLLSPLSGIDSHEAAIEKARGELAKLLTLPPAQQQKPTRQASRRTTIFGGRPAASERPA